MDTKESESPTQNQIQMIVRQLLPEIQVDLVKQYQEKYDQQMNKKIHEEQTKLFQQAESQYNQMLDMIQHQCEKSINNTYKQLQKQLNDLEITKKEYQNKLKNQKLSKLKQELLITKFQTQILVHPYFLDLQKKIAQQVQEKLKSKFEVELNRKQKQFLVKLKQKQDKEQQQFQRDYRQECQYRIIEQKKQLQKNRVQLARFKSDYNIKVKKFSTQRKQLEIKYRESSANFERQKQSLQNQLAKLLEETQKQIINNHNKKIQELEGQQSDNQKYYDQSKRESIQNIDDEDEEIPTHKVIVPTKMVSSSSSDEFQKQPEFITSKNEQQGSMSSFWSKPKKIIDFNAKQYLQSMKQFQEQNTQTINKNLQQRDFKKYIPTTIPQLDTKQKKSNFREQYERYLKSISIVKKNKLSAATKNIIINNFMKSAGQNKKNNMLTSIR